MPDDEALFLDALYLGVRDVTSFDRALNLLCRLFDVQSATLLDFDAARPEVSHHASVGVLSGEIFDVIVDIRAESPAHGEWLGMTLSAATKTLLYIPEGFAHGFLTLEPDSMVAYKVTSGYEPKSERGIAWDDPDLGIAWPAALKASAALSARDRQWPRLKDATDLF